MTFFKLMHKLYHVLFNLQRINLSIKSLFIMDFILGKIVKCSNTWFRKDSKKKNEGL